MGIFKQEIRIMIQNKRSTGNCSSDVEHSSWGPIAEVTQLEASSFPETANLALRSQNIAMWHVVGLGGGWGGGVWVG